MPKFTPTSMRSSLSQRQIPTLLGIGVLIVALVGGIFGLNQGFSAFSPRAAPQSTPKELQITNVRDTGFTVSFLTDEATAGFVKYGTDASQQKTQASDDRDQLSGSVNPYTTHFITVHDLQPDTTYYFTAGTGSSNRFDNNGTPFSIKTAKRGGTPAAAKTAYGTVNTAGGTPAAGAIVYLDVNGVKLSSLVKDTGSWANPLSSARSTDGTQYLTVADTDTVNILVQGVTVASKTNLSVSASQLQPVATITIGAAGGSAPAPVTQASPDVPAVVTPITTQAPAQTNQLSGLVAASPSVAPAASPVSTAPTGSTTVDLRGKDGQQVGTAQPRIMGNAAPSSNVHIQIHSQTVINTNAQADVYGNYSVDLSSLSQNLEPGDHTITVSYYDPKLKKTVTQTKTFTVAASGTTAVTSPAPTSTLLADNSTSNNSVVIGSNSSSSTSPASSPVPFGTSNPFTINSPTPSPTFVASPSGTPRTTQPRGGKGLPVSGSTTPTWFLIFGGLFFVIAGGFIYLQSLQAVESVEELSEGE